MENSHNEAIFKQSLLDRRKWQIVTPESEIKPVISRARKGKHRWGGDVVVIRWLNHYTLARNTFPDCFQIPKLCPGFPGERTLNKTEQPLTRSPDGKLQALEHQNAVGSEHWWQTWWQRHLSTVRRTSVIISAVQ